jgi:undecaprenyl-diphosphatase
MLLADLGLSIHGLTGHSVALDDVMQVLAQYLIYAVVVIVAVLWFHRDGLRAGVAFAVGTLLALGIGVALGSLWVEQRPFVADHFAPLISHAVDGSFPSDHLLVLGALTGACWSRARRLALLAGGVAVLVAVGRVFVGVHYPIDVVAGFAIGVVSGWIAWWASRYAQPLLDRLDRGTARLRVRPILFGARPRSDPD